MNIFGDELWRKLLGWGAMSLYVPTMLAVLAGDTGRVTAYACTVSGVIVVSLFFTEPERMTRMRELLIDPWTTPPPPKPEAKPRPAPAAPEPRQPWPRMRKVWVAAFVLLVVLVAIASPYGYQEHPLVLAIQFPLAVVVFWGIFRETL